MKKSHQIIWNILSVIMFIISAAMIFKGRDKILNYFNSTEYPVLNKNVYVGGDAYNYIINSNYAISFFVLALIFSILGVAFLIIGYLDKIKIINETLLLKNMGKNINGSLKNISTNVTQNNEDNLEMNNIIK